MQFFLEYNDIQTSKHNCLWFGAGEETCVVRLIIGAASVNDCWKWFTKKALYSLCLERNGHIIKTDDYSIKSIKNIDYAHYWYYSSLWKDTHIYSFPCTLLELTILVSKNISEQVYLMGVK